MRAPHEAMKVIAGPLQHRDQKGVVVKTRELVKCKYVPLLLSF